MTEHEDREALAGAVQSVTWNASNYPAKVRPHILGQDVVPLSTKIADAVLTWMRSEGYVKPEPVSDDEREALARAIRRGSGSSYYQSDLLASQTLPHLDGFRRPRPGKRLDPEFRAEIVEFAKSRIKDVWADVPGGVDAETLAQNVVAAQEFAWIARGFPVETPVPAGDDEREALIEEATWALIEWDTDTVDRGVRDEHYRERRADVERVLPILFRRPVQGEPTDAIADAVAKAIIEHVEGNLTCFDHDGFCCPCGDLHNAGRQEWRRHQARAALRAAAAVAEREGEEKP